MADDAPPPAVVLAELAGPAARAGAGRALGALRRAGAARRRSRAPGSTGPPRRCCARSRSRGASRRCSAARGLAALADALGIEVEVSHRALPDAETCARVFCALFGRLCASAATVGRRRARCCGPRGGARPRPRPRAAARRAARATGPTSPRCRRTPASTCSATPTGARSTSASRSPCARARERTSRRAGGHGPPQAEHVDYEATELRARRPRARAPADQGAQAARQRARSSARADGLVYLRCRLDIPFPILEVGARAGRGARASRVGPMRGRATAAELVEQLNSLFGLRHCGRTLPRRDHPSAYGQMGRCLSPCLRDLDPNLYRERLDAALGLFSSAATAAQALLAHVEGQMRAAPTRGATSARRGCAAATRGCEALLARLGGVLRSIHAGARLVLAPHPTTRAATTRCGSRRAGSSTGARCPTTRESSRGPATRCERPGRPRRRLAAGRRGRRGAPRRRVAGRQRGVRARARAAPRRGRGRGVRGESPLTRRPASCPPHEPPGRRQRVSSGPGPAADNDDTGCTPAGPATSWATA